MRNLMKLIAVTAMAALLLLALVSCASADEKIYTSPVFKLPRERLEKAEEILEAQENESEPEESEDLGDEPEEETDEPGEDVEELEDGSGEVTEEDLPQKREVVIKSSQGAIVTEGDLIELTSELRGFGDDEQVEYQWQVDRGDGAGWVDVAGGNDYKYSFVANRETIQYSWRLIVDVVE